MHNRVTKQMRLEPFALLECEQYLKYLGVIYNRMQIAEIYMVCHLYGICLLAFQFSQLVGLVLGDSLGAALPENTAIISLSFAVLFLLFVAALLVFGGGKSQLQRWLTGDWSLGRESHTANDSAAVIKCEQLAREYNLTERESEVLLLLARGRNAAHIGNSLFISKDTAKTHIKNIYKKIDIHSREELYDLIDESSL